MEIIYFYQYFSTPKGSWGTRVYEFAKKWVEDGHKVTVVTSVYSKSDLKANSFIENQIIDGINIKIINIKIDNKQHFIRRVWSFLLYSLVSSFYAIRLKGDIVIASSGPISVGIPGLISKYLRNRKLVFETRDLWPEGAIELGLIKSNTVKKFAYWFENICYKSADFIVTLSPGMTSNIKTRFKISYVDDVTNAANIELFSTHVMFNSRNLVPKSYAIYTGNIGVVNNSTWLFESARELKRMGRSDIQIVLIGEGQQREELETMALNDGVENFIRIGLMPKLELVGYIQNAFVSLVPLKGTPVLDTSSPNKFFESLAAGVPVIQNTNGWMKDFLIEHNVGFTLNPNDPTELARTLVRMKDNPLEVANMGKKCSLVAKKYFDKDFLAQKMLNILIDVHGAK